MIAFSDAVLILASTAALGSGLYRWQNNIDQHALGNTANTVSAQIQAAPRPQVQNNSTIEPAPMTGMPSATATATTVISSPSSLPTPTPTPIPAPSTTVVVDVPETVTIDVTENQTTSTSDQNGKNQEVGTHIVASGDTLNRIAYRYGTSVSVIQEMNGLEDTVINIGETLIYPLAGN